MKKPWIAAAAVVLALGLASTFDAEAKRLGGGRSAGMQRQTTTAPPNTPAQPAGTTGTAAPSTAAAPAAAGAPAAAAAATAKRSWMGPIAGLAAGLGLAALASHLGFGEALANFMMIALLGFALLAVIGFVMRKRAAQQPAFAGAGGVRGGSPTQQNGSLSSVLRTATDDGAAGRGSLIGSRLGTAGAATAAAGAVPSDFDAQGFARNAKDQFMALQAANDAGDLERLRHYLTPEMFDVVRDEVAARNGAQQATQVFGLEATVIAVEQEADRYIVSVRFTGSVRDQHGAVPEDLDEVWHLTKPVTGMGGWVVGGIQQAGAGN